MPDGSQQRCALCVKPSASCDIGRAHSGISLDTRDTIHLVLAFADEAQPGGSTTSRFSIKHGACESNT